MGSAIIMWNSNEEEDDCLHGAVILTDDAIHHSQFQDESSDIKNRNHIYSKWAYKKELWHWRGHKDFGDLSNKAWANEVM